MTHDQLAAFLENLPGPEGFDWLVVGSDAYTRACQAELPTFYAEYCTGDEFAMVYLVGQHQLAGTVQP